MRKSLLVWVAYCMIVSGFAAGQIFAEEPETAVEIQHFYITPFTFASYGSWALNGDVLQGRSVSQSPEPEPPPPGEPAIAEVMITEPGEYRLWVRDRDFATNQPGTRTFHVGVDGVLAGQFGKHGQDGFRWSEVGVFALSAGMHELELHDTSGFFARSEGFFLSNDLDLVPPQNLAELIAIAPPYDPFVDLPSAQFPAWAKADVAVIKSDVIENDTVRVVFYQGAGSEGDLVQNEIYIKDGSEWVKVKGKKEELGFLMMQALTSDHVGEREQFSMVQQRVMIDGQPATRVVDNYFRSGYPVWFIPDDYEKTADNRIELSFANTEADLRVIFELDSLSDDPKVTLQADFVEDGAYSFMLYNGDATDAAAFDTVTAPLLYVKKAVPSDAYILPESYLFTPMATLHYEAGNTLAPGREWTAGVAMDPSSVPLGFTYPDTSSFGLVLRDPQGGGSSATGSPNVRYRAQSFRSG